jgi:UV DNA damage repair endonuclease
MSEDTYFEYAFWAMVYKTWTDPELDTLVHASAEMDSDAS